jgi:c-di-GMP-binding flagellar brake protein YcgR
MTERRKFKRFQTKYPVEYGLEGERKALSLIDISEKGLSFASREKIREKQRFNLHIFLKRKMFNIKAVVVHARKGKKKPLYNVGAQFLAIPEDFRETLMKEMEEIKAESFRSKKFLRNT